MSHRTELIWQTYSSQLKTFVLKRIPDSTFADDILQEVFIKIHEKIDTLKDVTKISHWIYQVTNNTINDYYRNRKLKLSDLHTIAENEFGVMDEVDGKRENQPTERAALDLKEMIDTLPQKYAQALTMVELQGVSQVQFAKDLQISVSGAKSRVQRGRQLLKDSLMKCCHYEFDKYGTVISSHPISCCCCSKSR